MNYPTYWRRAYVAAFFFHIIVWLFISLVVPRLHFTTEATPALQEIEWQTVDDTPADDPGDPNVKEKQEQPQPAEPIKQPAENPEPPVAVDETTPVEDTTPVVADNPEDAIAQLVAAEKKPNAKVSGNVAIRSNSNGQTMGNPAKLIHEVQPAEGAIPFKGRISVSAHIDKKGNVAKTSIMISSGNMIYDNIAMSIVKKQWKFTPATDVEGKPMESNYICSLYFNVPQHRKN